MRISSPPVRFPCFYGIDMATQKELIGAVKSVDEIREHIGADTLGYLSPDGLIESVWRAGQPDVPRLLHGGLPHRRARGVRDVQDALREGRGRGHLRVMRAALEA